MFLWVLPLFRFTLGFQAASVVLESFHPISVTSFHGLIHYLIMTHGFTVVLDYFPFLFKQFTMVRPSSSHHSANHLTSAPSTIDNEGLLQWTCRWYSLDRRSILRGRWRWMVFANGLTPQVPRAGEDWKGLWKDDSGVPSVLTHGIVFVGEGHGGNGVGLVSFGWLWGLLQRLGWNLVKLVKQKVFLHMPNVITGFICAFWPSNISKPSSMESLVDVLLIESRCSPSKPEQVEEPSSELQ